MIEVIGQNLFFDWLDFFLKDREVHGSCGWCWRWEPHLPILIEINTLALEDLAFGPGAMGRHQEPPPSWPSVLRLPGS